MRIRRAAALVGISSLFLTLSFWSPLPKSAKADGPRDNDPAHVRPIPPVGNDLSPADRESLQSGLDALGKEIESLRVDLKDKPDLLGYLPDVQIFYNAVRYPLEYHETVDPAMSRKALGEGMERAKLLRQGKTPWTSVTAARGYVSRIDGSVQPYVLSIPAEYREAKGIGDASKRYRLDVWGHGRDELLTELRFVEMDDLLHELKYLHQETEPKDKFILSLYGRYITAFKFAGEIDGLEALEEVRRHYPIDDNRLLDIGFSMGGAAAWEYAVHYTDLWAAASPAAGFSETPEFLKVFQKEDVSNAPWYQQVLWHLYDCTDYAANLYNLPTIAYAGELDPQKQASDAMLRATEAEGVKIERLIGPQTGHHYPLAVKEELDRKLDAILARGRNPVPDKLRFTTWTLRYNRMYWVTVDALEHHWRRARADGEITRDRDGKAAGVSLRTENVTALTITFPAGLSPFRPERGVNVTLDGQKVISAQPDDDGGYAASFVRHGEHWVPVLANAAGKRAFVFPAPHKRHGLQGPIDDAFMERFLMVKPTGKPLNEKTGAWEAAECEHAIKHWRQQFRGDARVKDDTDVTDADLADGNVVLFGDPSSNKVLARLADKLPIRWTNRGVALGERTFAADHHVPVLVYPNPLHPDHYVVVNSGFTYREYDYLNNARQTPKLPDYAVIDVDVPADSRSPGGVVAAGFFGENWELLPDDGKGK